MSTNASQSNARYSHRASVRAMWVIAAVLAVSYAGDEHIVRPFVSGQDSAPQNDSPATAATDPAPNARQATAEVAPESEATAPSQPNSSAETNPQPADQPLAPSDAESTASPNAASENGEVATSIQPTDTLRAP